MKLKTALIGAASLLALVSYAQAETKLTIATVNNGDMIRMQGLTDDFTAANKRHRLDKTRLLVCGNVWQWASSHFRRPTARTSGPRRRCAEKRFRALVFLHLESACDAACDPDVRFNRGAAAEAIRQHHRDQVRDARQRCLEDDRRCRGSARCTHDYPL